MILVSGASRGLGRAIAEHLVDQGREVVGFSRSLAETPYELINLDVSSEASVSAVARSLRDRYSPPEALINAAGIASLNLAILTPPHVTRRIIEVNLLGTMFMCQAFSPQLVRGGGGIILNFSTIAVPLALAGESAYVASKAGIEGYSRTLARELAGHNIRVNCIAPGPIETDLIKGVAQSHIVALVERQVIQRQFQPSDVCDIVDLLLSPESASITGHVLHIGGV